MSPFEGFDMIKAAYTKKHKEAVRSGDDATAARVLFKTLYVFFLNVRLQPSYERCSYNYVIIYVAGESI